MMMKKVNIIQEGKKDVQVNYHGMYHQIIKVKMIQNMNILTIIIIIDHHVKEEEDENQKK